MGSGFRLTQMSRKTLLVGVLVLVGIPVAVFVLVTLSDAPSGVAWWGTVVLLYYFVFGAYVYARYGGEWSMPPEGRQ
ncbi:hypothetical protein [Halorussus litoreus]|uniref:hypothetical protein n=1 Tax=Halorussus litoreus TaxID=1710536 RepID=UPI000E233DCA|nr:hypothetical protein [Halorussus litoreus]